jgi:hypothetical protein
VTPSLVGYNFSPANRSFSLLANRTDAVFTANHDAVIGGNAIDTPEYFVRQHYLDFLGREPDESGFNFWSDQMRECGLGSLLIVTRSVINSWMNFFTFGNSMKQEDHLENLD